MEALALGGLAETGQLLAQIGHYGRLRQCLPLGAKRKSDFQAVMTAWVTGLYARVSASLVDLTIKFVRHFVCTDAAHDDHKLRC